MSFDLSLITKDGSAVTAEDLSEGDMLILTLDDSGSVTAAQLMGGRGGMGGRAMEGNFHGRNMEGSAGADQNTTDQTTPNA